MSRTRTHLLRTALLATGVLAAAFTVVFLRFEADPTVADDPGDLAEQAAVALRGARAEGAGRRAPVTLARAEELYAEALLERRRQQLRFRWLRDFREARAALEAAADRAEDAIALSQRSVRRDRTVAARVLAAADAAVASLGGTEDRIWMADSTRQRLQRARALASEARSFMDAEAYADAAARARSAREEAEAVAAALRGATVRFTDDDHIGTWRQWAAETVAWSKRSGKTAVVVDKDAHRVLVYQAGQVVREYGAELGWNNVGDKRHQGDGATPEGRYKVVEMKGRGRSRYHKALLLDYPNREDVAALNELKAAGAVPAGTRAGGLIEIHGEGGRGKDWTDGCVAITNAQMDWLFARVGVGTPVTIVGSLSGDGAFAEVARRLER